MVLMVFFSSRISPFTSTVILRDKSPRATAVVTSAMLRTCVVRFAANRFTLSVKSFQVPADSRNHGLPPQSAVGAHFARHSRDLAGEGTQLIDHGVQRFLQEQDFAAHIDRDLARQIAGRDRGGDLRDIAHLRGEIAGHGIDVVGEVLPGAGNAGHLRLAAQLALGADLARNAGHFAGEAVQLIDHGIDGVLELEDFALHVHRDLARQIARATAVVTSAMLRT